VAIAAALALGGAGVASGAQVEKDGIALSTSEAVTPLKLPKTHFRPASLFLGFDISLRPDGLQAPGGHATIELDRNTRFRKAGLPACDPAGLENTTVADARARCGAAMVGTGSADSKVRLPGDPTVLSNHSVLSAFNGPGNLLLLHFVIELPAPESYVVPVAVSGVNDGRYGTRLDAELPRIAGGYGRLVHLDTTVAGRYKRKGKTVGFFEARCHDGRLQAKQTLTVPSATFTGATTIAGEDTLPCKGQKRK
jgi:hypothetical protein